MQPYCSDQAELPRASLGGAAALVTCRRPWVLELVRIGEAVAELPIASDWARSLQLLWCFPAWSRSCLSARFCREPDLAAVAGTLEKACEQSEERPEVIVLRNLPQFLPGLLRELSEQLHTPLVPAEEWSEGWKGRFYRRIGARLPQSREGTLELGGLNRWLERLVAERLLL